MEGLSRPMSQVLHLQFPSHFLLISYLLVLGVKGGIFYEDFHNSRIPSFDLNIINKSI